MRKIISCFLVTLLCLLTLTSCGEKWIVNYEGSEIPFDIYSYYAYSAYEMLQYNNSINGSKPLSEQMVENKDEDGNIIKTPADEYINNYAIDETLFLCELEKRFKDAGLELDEDTLASIEASAKNEYSAYENLFKKNGITEETVKRASGSGEMGAKRDQLFKYLYGEKGPNEVAEEQLNEYYSENYVSYSYIYRSLVDSGGVVLEDDGKAVIKAELEDIKAKIESGKADIETYAKEYANEYANDKHCGKNGVANMTAQKANNKSSLMEVIAGMKNGELRFVEHNNEIFLLKKNDIQSTGYFDSADNRYNILIAMKYDEFIKEITDASLKSEHTINEKALKKYGIDKFEL